MLERLHRGKRWVTHASGLEWTCVGILRGSIFGLFWDVLWSSIMFCFILIADWVCLMDQLVFWCEFVVKLMCSCVEYIPWALGFFIMSIKLCGSDFVYTKYIDLSILLILFFSFFKFLMPQYIHYIYWHFYFTNFIFSSTYVTSHHEIHMCRGYWIIELTKIIWRNRLKVYSHCN